MLGTVSGTEWALSKYHWWCWGCFFKLCGFLNFELSSLSPLISCVALLILIPSCVPVWVYLFISMVTARAQVAIISPMEFCDFFPTQLPRLSGLLLSLPIWTYPSSIFSDINTSISLPLNIRERCPIANINDTHDTSYQLSALHFMLNS